ncbi:MULTISPECIES: type 1 glutamine amidotransferase domain-containing protein [unclassified Bradyrhizobium]|uniref:type 1 glutamine amidotransferase domain-containing protein n=1 Tax=unclassified Bradyrhizobium TaxID=2631580 RepID=UPI000368F5EB|nr:MULTISPECIES: type 1 glutamine amidotransferase domain-containing protein [unclassified Bradyrhizobium]MBB4262455.1 putative intracellular protease/amidase [Bradyrhizobium sp. CIR3A]MBB4361711.1 putative intracellular protease/amidase [Bradyrhizobium sp. CIR18]MBB4378424.1 putative intracellular protease/amidase [Bradyrhizobium sp. SBR1B]MBB4396056.1 putative intracellular protease/amidase [Bradyrhizobium sp. ERR14]MBB4426552.1 putative intracellular protease/amidase [Bradyrhizobium sp. CIR
MGTGNRQKRILLIMSSVDEMGISGKQTGTWFHELAAPYYILTKAGFEVVFASPRGGEAPIDLLSMKSPFTTEYTERFLADPVAMFAARNTRKLRNIDYRTYDAVFFPGGYGLLWDLASDSYAIKLIRDFHNAQRPIAMVCHAPAILRDVKKDDGQYLVNGLNLTGFKNAEDTEIELLHHLLFSLEDELRNRGAKYQSKANWEPNVVVDGVLMTGQSPASAVPLAEALANRLA